MRSITDKLEALSRMTVRNGCTPAEAAAAQRKLHDLLIYVHVGYTSQELRASSGANFAELQKRPKPWAKLSPQERARIEKIELQEDAKDRQARRHKENLVLARTILTSELLRRHPQTKREAAEKLVKDAVGKLLSGQH